MALKKMTVMVDEDDLQRIKEAAARDGRPESEYIREALHLAAQRLHRWEDEWEIPTLDYGRPITDDDVREASAEAVTRGNRAAS